MAYFICLEGTDGSGKATQSKLLKDFLAEQGYKVGSLSFPVYESESSLFVRRLLNGELKPNSLDIDPYQTSFIFEIDRLISMIEDWGNWINDYDIIVSDRYTTANIIHQGIRLQGSERRELISWLQDLTFNKLKLPKPNLIFYLHVSLEYTMNLLKNRNSLDTYEKNIEYQTRVIEEGYSIAKKLGWCSIECIKNGDLRSIDNIHKEIIKEVMRRLNND